jgi:RNA polymerase sigma-70 factor (ECF subfamily)
MGDCASDHCHGWAAGASFATTHWGVVLSACNPTSAPSAQALETLCRTYWYPLYACVRRRGHDAHTAQDLTQEFFARLLARDGLARVDQGKGRFRSFLLGSLNHFLANEWHRARAAKRGGGAEVISLDDATAEQRYALEPASDATPDKLFERRWALTLLDRALARLREEFTAGGRGEQFDWLKEFLHSDESERPYADVGAERGLKPSAVASAVYRFRQRYRELVRDEIAQTVAGAEELEDELRWLFAALS